jgi:hypothetical protein
MFSLFFIVVGLYIYYSNFGWNLTFEPSLAFYSSALFILLGLILIMQRRRRAY